LKRRSDGVQRATQSEAQPGKVVTARSLEDLTMLSCRGSSAQLLRIGGLRAPCLPGARACYIVVCGAPVWHNSTDALTNRLPATR
jgi:hypothetical protein